MKIVRFASREDAEKIEGRKDGCVISIRNPGTPPPNLHPDWGAILSLQFHDTDPAKPMSSKLRQRVAEKLPWMTIEDATALIKFVRRMSEKKCEYYLVHCESGVSRSPAVAKWIAREFRLQDPGPAARIYNRHVYGLLCQVAGMRRST